MRRVVMTGANRGLGLEFVRQYLARGDRVFAAARRPEASSALRELAAGNGRERLTLLALDVADAESIRAAHEKVRSAVDGLDVLINNAGVYTGAARGGASTSDAERREAEKLGELTFEDGMDVLRVNAVAPVIIAQQFRDLLRAGERPCVVNISSGYGSVSSNNGGFPYHYSASKAALNMYMRSLAGDVKKDGIVCVLMDPGWVRTDMGGPDATLSVEQSVGGMVKVIDKLSDHDNGQFLTWDGGKQPW